MDKETLWFEQLTSNLAGSGRVAYIWDPRTDFYEWAGDLAALLGVSADEAPGSNPEFHKHLNPQDIPERLSVFHDLLARAPSPEKSAAAADPVVLPPQTLSYRIRRENGAHIDVEETIRIKNTGTTAVICGQITIREAEQLTQPGAHGYQNFSPIAGGLAPAHEGRHSIRYAIEHWLESYRHHADREGYLLIAGIDRLSLLNQAFGPTFTDEIIDKAAHRLHQIVDDTGMVSRIDGDVFAVFFDRSPMNEMAAVAAHILKNFHDNPLATSKGPVGVTLSMGGVLVKGGQEKPESAADYIVQAESAMAAAKEQGRNCFVPYNKKHYQGQQSRLLLKASEDFLGALRDKRVMLAFQPVISSLSNQTSFHESLIRMVDREGKIIPAGKFMPAIEKLGLSRLVDQYALSSAIDELSLFPALQLSVNVSNLTLVNQDWLRGLVARLRKTPSVAGRLIIEITESAAIKDMTQTARIVKTLKDLGCRVALDDFGAGYTAFTQMKGLDVDIVKIDKSFVRQIKQEQNHLFVKTLQSLAEGLNVETVGEGAETMDDARTLIDDGIDHIQGYVYGFPRTERVWLPKDHSFRHMVKGQMHDSDESSGYENNLKRQKPAASAKAFDEDKKRLYR